MPRIMGDNFIHPGSFFIIQLDKAQGALVRWDIGCENRPLVSAALDAVWGSYRQFRDFLREAE